MRFTPSPISKTVSFMIACAVLTPVQASQGVHSMSFSPESTAAYWTPERMQNAEPMDMPRVQVGALKERSYTRSADPEGEDGSPPTYQEPIEPLFLFKPIEKPIVDTKKPLNSGTINQHFTSSRLIPVTADTLYPYRTIGKVFFTTPSGNKTCSASVIRRRIVLTAGHCVHSGNGATNGWYSNFMFVPGFDSGTAPFLTWNITTASVQHDWYGGGGTVPNPTDYGVLVITDQNVNGVVQAVGNVVGYLGWQSESTFPNHAHIIGYSNGFDSGNLMHEVTAESARVVDANNVEYGSDMSVGAGGSPWIQNFGEYSVGQTGGTNSGSNRIVGTSSYAYNNNTYFSNGGSIFDNRFVVLMDFICGLQAGNC